MKTFRIKLGKGRNALTLDAARLVEGRCLIQGASGSGKSYLVRVLMEQTIPHGLQTIVLDPEGEFATLREKVKVLIAGKGQDVPVELRSAKLLARRIAETGISAVVDLSDLKLDERRQFVAIFLDTLDNLPKKLERPRIVVLDEAHKFCPESGKGKATSTEAVITLMSQGRKRGLCGILLTQRLSKLKKDAAAEASNVIIGKTSPIDLHSAQDMLGVVKEDREALRSLKPGAFYVTGPALEGDEDVVVFQARKATTTHPQPGSRYKLATPPTPTAIKRILKEFAALPPEQAVEDAQNLAEAKTRIRALEKQLKKAERASETAAPAEPDLSAYVPKTHHEAVRKAYERREKTLQKVLARLQGLVEQGCEGLLAQVRLSQEQVERKLGPVPEDFVLHATRTGRTQSAQPNLSNHPRAKPKIADRAPRGGAFQRMLMALAREAPVPMDKAELGVKAGISSKSGTFRNYLTKGKQLGYWTVHAGTITLEEAGVEAAGDFAPLPSQGRALVEWWCAHKSVTGKAGDMLRVIAENGEDGITKEDLALNVGISVKSGTFRNYLSRLRTLKLVERGDPLVAAESLWEG